MIYRLRIRVNMQEQEYILISVVPCGPAVGGSLSTQYTDRLLIKHMKITSVLHVAANKSPPYDKQENMSTKSEITVNLCTLISL